jgi:membrane protein required for colicin V production
MNYLDIVIVISLLYGLIKGLSNGLIKEITGLLGLFIGVYVAINFSSYLNPKFAEFLKGHEKFVPIISFTTLFIVSVISIKILGYIIDQFTKAIALGFVSRLLGGVFGFLKIVVILSVLLSLIREYKLIDKQTQEKSTLLIPLQRISKIIIPKINKHKKIILDATKKSAEKAKQTLEKKINP